MEYSTFSLIKVMRRFLQTDNLQQNSHLKTSGRLSYSVAALGVGIVTVYILIFTLQ